MSANKEWLFLGYGTIIVCSLSIVGILLSLSSSSFNNVSKLLPLGMIAMLIGFMFLFSYIPLSIYQDEKEKEIH